MSRLHEAQRRHARHYNRVAHEAEELYERGTGTLPRGLEMFGAEWPNVRVSQSWSARYSDKDDAAAALCCDYPGACRFLLDVYLHPRENIDWLDPAIAAARRLGQKDIECGHLNSLGLEYLKLAEVLAPSAASNRL